jgi:hypothetical protein
MRVLSIVDVGVDIEVEVIMLKRRDMKKERVDVREKERRNGGWLGVL